MGTEFVLKLYAPADETAQTAARAAFDRIAALDERLSDYNPKSELSQLSKSAGGDRALCVSDDLWKMLTMSVTLSERSDGAFDVTAGPFIRLWRQSRKTGRLPKAGRLERARQAVGYRRMQLDASSQTAKLLTPNMRLDLGGIAKGYAADEALRVLCEHDCQAALVDAGGDLAIGAPPPGETGWKIAVATLDETEQPRVLTLRNCGVATSGDRFQHVTIDGVRYSHIVDPRTGLGVTTPGVVTVIAPDATTADSLASAISVLGPERGMELADDTRDVAAAMVIQAGNVLKRVQSKRMEQFETAPLK